MKNQNNNKIAILMSGGDAPGMNAALYRAALLSKTKNIELYLVFHSYNGLISNDIRKANLDEIKEYFQKPGCFIKSERCLKFKDIENNRKIAADNLLSRGIDKLLVVGGNGSYQGAEKLSELGVNVLAMPGTIDNDVESTDYTIGFHSSFEEIFQAVNKLKYTADSCGQIIFVEVMGRYCSDLAIYAGIAAQVDLIVDRNTIMSPEEIKDFIKSKKEKSDKGIIIIFCELIYGEKFGYNLPSLSDLAQNIQAELNYLVRLNVLGYTQRGAMPTGWEIFHSMKYIDYAFSLIEKNTLNQAIGFNGKDYFHIPIDIANKFKKSKKTSLILEHNKLLNSL